MLQPLPVKIGYVSQLPRSSSIRSRLRKTVHVSVSALVIAVTPPSKSVAAFDFLGYTSFKEVFKAPSKAKPAALIPETKKLPSHCKKNCQLTDNGYAIIRLFEGYSPFIYKDVAGYPTIGYGHLILKGEVFKTPLLPTEAQTLLSRDASSKVRDVNKLVRVELNPNQFDALASFTFNVGSGALAKSTLLKRVNTEQHELVPAQFERYVNAGGKRVKGLVTRRFAESNLYQTPID